MKTKIIFRSFGLLLLSLLAGIINTTPCEESITVFSKKAIDDSIFGLPPNEFSEFQMQELVQKGQGLSETFSDIQKKCLGLNFSEIQTIVNYSLKIFNQECKNNLVEIFTNLLNSNNLTVGQNVKNLKFGIKSISHAAKGISKKGKKVAKTSTKVAKTASNQSLHTLQHSPAIYSKLNAQTGGMLDMAVIVGAGAAGTAVGGPLGGMAGGMIGQMAVSALHSQDGQEVTQEQYQQMPEQEQQNYNAKVEQQQQELAHKISDIFTKLPEDQKEKVQKMSPEEQQEFFAKKIKKEDSTGKYEKGDKSKKSKNHKKGKDDKNGKGDKKKKKKKRLLSVVKSSIGLFENALIKIAYKINQVCGDKSIDPSRFI